MGNDVLEMVDKLSFGQMGSGFLIGLSVGYFFKKSLKLMLFVLGFVLVVVFVLNSNNIIEVNSSEIVNNFDKIAVNLKHFALYLKHNLSTLEVEGGAGAVAGFLVGLKIG